MQRSTDEDAASATASWGRLTLLRTLGRGANGEVFLARDPESDEEVALKVLHSRDPWALEGFKNEARFLCDLSHPALVAPTELIAHDGGLALVMPFVDGRPFTTVLAEAAGPPEAGALAHAPRVRALVSGLFEALAALHERGFVHLDLKPDNVLVTTQDEVLVLDFGLARLRDAATAAGEMSGSALWMAPEQLMLDTLTPATDVFAAGLLVYAGLTGVAPWNIADGLMARAFQPPRDLATIRPAISADWSALLLGLLATEASARPEPSAIVRQLAPTASPSGAVVARPAVAPSFQGRAAELAQLAGLLDRAFAGLSGLARVYGEPGMGKTAVVSRFAAQAALRGAFVIYGRCFAAESIPFKALDAALDQLATRARADLEVTTFIEASPDLPALARVFPIFGKFLPTGPAHIEDAPAQVSMAARTRDEDLPRVRALLRALVRRLAEAQPIVLVIEDVHWGDSDAVDALMALVEPPDAPRVLVILTHREGEVWSSSPFAVAFERRLQKGVPFQLATVEIARLSPEAAWALAARALGVDQTAAIAAAVATANGNALVLTRLLAEPDATDLVLAGLVAKSLARFSPAVRRFVGFASLAGRPLPLALLARAAGVPVPARATLVDLAAQSLLRTAYQGSGRVAMPHHDSVREAVNDLLTPEERTTAHRSLAEVLAATTDADGDLGLVAFHYAGAGDVAGSTRWALRAADVAERTSAFARAAELLEQVLSGDPRHLGEGRAAATLAATRRALQLRLARALREAGHGRDAARTYHELGRTAAEPAERRTHLRAASDALMALGDIDEGLAVMKPVMTELGIAVGASGFTRSLRLVGGAFGILTGRRKGRAAPSADPAAAERFDTCWPIAKALIFVTPLVGLELMLRALTYAEASGDPERVARVTGPLAGFVLGSMPGFKTTAQRWVEQLGGHSKSPYSAGVETLWRALLAGAQGRLVESKDLSEEAIERLRRVEDTHWERFQALSILARVLVTRGHFTTAMSLVQSHLPDAERRGDLHAQVVLASYRLLPAIAAGRTDEARAIADWTLRNWLPDRYSPQTFYALRGRYLADLVEGRNHEAARAIAAGRAAFEKAGGYRIVFSRFDHDLLEARAVLALDRAPEPGLWPIDRLITRLERLAMPEGAAHAQLLRASMTARAGDRTNTLTWLARATHSLDAAGVDLEGQIARLRTAQLLGQEAPADAARLALRQLGLANPDRWAGLVAPGYDGLVANARAADRPAARPAAR